MPIPDYALRLLRAVPDAAIYVAAHGEILAANDAARDALGLGCALRAGQDLAELVEDPAGELAQTLRSWSRSSDPLPGSFAVTSSSGTTTFNGKGSVVFSGSEERPPILLVRFWPRASANPFVLLNQKIAELNYEVDRRVRVEEALRRSEAALRERAKEAEELNRAKDEFLATVSHELRTPLNAILGWASLLRGRAGAAEVEKALEVIQRNAVSQGKLIEDILDVSRIISGKMRLETRPADLVAIVTEAVEVVRPSAAAKQLHISLARPAEACLLVADPDRLQQAVWNLLSNAVKFTDRGGSVRVQIERRGSQLALTVTDTGRGIEPSFLPLVFDRFKQADSSTTRRVGGLGLGLALVRHIVELHGGSVDVHSEGLGTGATFTMTLPVRAVTSTTVAEPSRAASTPERKASERAGPIHGVRVLVVDDEADARELLAAVLTQAGGEVETAASVNEAFVALRRFSPHVLVSDIGMPEEDGYSFMRRLRLLRARDGGATPAVALSAYTRAEDRVQALAAGFTTHVDKPVNPEDLIAAVASLGVVTTK